MPHTYDGLTEQELNIDIELAYMSIAEAASGFIGKARSIKLANEYRADLILLLHARNKMHGIEDDY